MQVSPHQNSQNHTPQRLLQNFDVCVNVKIGMARNAAAGGSRKRPAEMGMQE
jgi:hypothetical protein